jgi:hypothetical protein
VPQNCGQSECKGGDNPTELTARDLHDFIAITHSSNSYCAKRGFGLAGSGLAWFVYVLRKALVVDGVNKVNSD